MKIKYDGTKYTVDAKDWLFISWKKFILFLKRQKRRCKLLFSGETLFLYLSITMLWFVFLFFTYLFGVKIATKTQIEYSFMDAIWELKNSFFTTVVLTFSIDILNKSREYKKKIKEQHELYVDALRDFQSILEPYVEDSCHYHFMYCNRTLEGTKRHIINQQNLMIDKRKLAVSLDKIARRLDILKSEYNRGNLQLRPNSYFLSTIEFAHDELITLINNKSVGWEEIFELIDSLQSVLDQVRYPWRCDIKIKKQILKHLAKIKTNDIGGHFYYSMLLYGCPFDKKIRLYKR